MNHKDRWMKVHSHPGQKEFVNPKSQREKCENILIALFMQTLISESQNTPTILKKRKSVSVSTQNKKSMIKKISIL